jgi:hypothetical protein
VINPVTRFVVFVADACPQLQEWLELAGAKKLETSLRRPSKDRDHT